MKVLLNVLCFMVVAIAIEVQSLRSYKHSEINGFLRRKQIYKLNKFKINLHENNDNNIDTNSNEKIVVFNTVIDLEKNNSLRW